jgi:hypothetical protein
LRFGRSTLIREGPLLLLGHCRILRRLEPGPSGHPVDAAPGLIGSPAARSRHGSGKRNGRKDAGLNEEAIQIRIDSEKLDRGLALERVQEDQGELLADTHLVEGLEHGAEQGSRIERIIVLADSRHPQERGKTTIQCGKLLRAIAGGACGKRADGQITLEIVGVDQTQLVGLAHDRRCRCRLQGRNARVETGDIGTAELLQELLAAVVEKIHRRKIELLVLQAGRPVGHAEKILARTAEMLRENGRQAVCKPIPTAGQQGGRIRRRQPAADVGRLARRSQRGGGGGIGRGCRSRRFSRTVAASEASVAAVDPRGAVDSARRRQPRLKSCAGSTLQQV